MKKILFFVFVNLLVTFTKAQNFEGIITWKITSEITDPKAKAQMDEAQQKMKDPETQAQMKEMQEKMNDPQVKAMMDANPQMKAQMEAALKMAQGGGDMSAMMPTGYTIKMKNQNVLSTTEGGMMAMEMLYLNDKKTTYKIDRQAKTYSPLPAQDPTQDPAKKADIKVTNTSETVKVLDYTCTKYIVESTTKGHTMQQVFWTTTAIKDFDFKSMAHQRMGNSQQSLFYEQIDGVPLKIEMVMPQGKMVMEVTELKKQSLSGADFAIPGGYKEVPLKY